MSGLRATEFSPTSVKRSETIEATEEAELEPLCTTSPNAYLASKSL